MVSHIGEIVKLPDVYAKGVINDHVDIIDHLSSGVHSVVVRRSYDVAMGPLPMPANIGDMGGPLLPETQRSWRKIDTIYEGVSLDEALRLGEAAAKRRRVVLYEPRDGLTHKIRWHPKGWEPIED